MLKGLFTGPNGAEGILEQALSRGLFHEWGPGGKKGKSVALWEKLSDGNPDVVGGTAEGPSPRGGHQMVRVGRKVVVFGGYDGRNLADMWERDLPRTAAGAAEDIGPWRELHPKGWGEAGRLPAARSCHQLAVDEAEGWIYLLGGIMDAALSTEEQRGTPPIPIPIPPLSPAADARQRNSNGNGDSADMEVEDDELSVPSEAPSRSASRQLDPLASDFWRYKAVGPGQGQWELLSEDTSTEGGPRLL